MRHASRLRWTVVASLLGYGAGAAIVATAAWGPRPIDDARNGAESIVALLPSIVLGLLVTWRRPESPAGPALLALGAAPSLTIAVETWGQSSFGTAHPWPLARLVATVVTGVWVFHLAGFVLLCLVFPNGRLPGRRWAAMPWLYLGVALVLIAVVALHPAQYAAHGGKLPGRSPVTLPNAAWNVMVSFTFLALAGVLAGAVASLVARYRRGDELTRLQLRWVVLGAGAVPALLAGGWIAEAAGTPIPVAYTPFLVAAVLVLPAMVALAILRHDLLDIDRLISSSAAWALTAAAAAGVFALVVFGWVELGRGVGLTPSSRPAVIAAAFITALLLAPLHRWLHAGAAHLLDRERAVMVAAMQQFVRRVRDGQDQPEAVEEVLRRSLDDPALEVLLKVPGTTDYVDLAGAARDGIPSGAAIALTASDEEMAVIVLGRSSARRLRRARELAVEARLPIEVSRLRMELRRALEDANASRARLVEAVTAERRRLERDLHDGAQQRILAVGMRLRSVQRQHALDAATDRDLDAAVAALEEIVHELRRLAHGVRPSRLDDGLAAAIHHLVRDSTLPIEVRVGDISVTDAVATTAYFVVAEGLANTFKHARASRARVVLGSRGDRLTVEVADDGRGGARPGSGLTALCDRVKALGGDFELVSPSGGGTTIRAEL